MSGSRRGILALVALCSALQTFCLGQEHQPRTNLIFNGDFEESPGVSPPPGWVMWGAQEFKVPANYTRDTNNPHDGQACFRIHHPAGTAGYAVTDPAKAIRPQPAMSYTIEFWARADKPRKALFGITAYETISPFKDAPSPGFFPIEVDPTWRLFSFEISEGFDFFADSSRYLLLTFKATTEVKEEATLWIDDVTATEAPSLKPRLLNEFKLPYPSVEHRLRPGESLNIVIDAGKALRPATREAGGISFHRVCGFTGHPFDKAGTYTLPPEIESAIRELHLPMTRFYAVGDEPFGVEAAIDRVAELCRRVGVPEAWTVLELETQSAASKLPPEVWENAVRYARGKGYRFRFWEIANEPYSSLWGQGGAFPTPEDYIRHVREVSAAIRRADTTAQVGIGIHSHNVKWGNYVLQQAAGCYDFVVAHHYASPRVYEEAFEDVVLTRNSETLDHIVRLNALIAAYNAGREVYQLDTEWGLHASGRAGERADYVDRNANIVGTLHRAVRLIYYTREGMVRGASSWQMLSHPKGQGFGVLFPTVPAGRGMLYWLYYYFNRHVGQTVVELSGTSPYHTPQRADQLALSMPLTPALATISQDRRTLFLIVVNGSWNRPVPFQVELRHFQPGQLTGVLLSHDDPDGKPLVERKEEFVHDFPATITGNILRGTIPAHAVVFLSVLRQHG